MKELEDPGKHTDEELEEVITKVTEDLIANNKPLDVDIAQLIDDNFWELVS